MAIDLLKEKNETAVNAEAFSSDEQSLHPENENKNVQKETPKGVIKGSLALENGIGRLWESKQENNLAEKLEMAFELFEMGLSEETIDRILNLNRDSKDKRL